VVCMQLVRRGSTVLAVNNSVVVNTLMAVTQSLENVSVNPAGSDRRAVRVSPHPVISFNKRRLRIYHVQ